MAEDLPSNLDDGELWLPSDVIRAVGDCRYHHHRRISGRTADDVAADELALAQKLASFGLLERRRSLHPVKPYQDFSHCPEFYGQGRPVIWSSQARGHKNPVAQRAAGGGTGAFFPVARTVHKFYPGIPVDSPADGFRARVLQRQFHGHGFNRHIPGRLMGSGRESGGTGVFLPRFVDVDSKKKTSSMVKGSMQVQQREAMRNPLMEKQAAKFLPPADVGLPHDWTY